METEPSAAPGRLRLWCMSSHDMGGRARTAAIAAASCCAILVSSCGGRVNEGSKASGGAAGDDPSHEAAPAAEGHSLPVDGGTLGDSALSQGASSNLDNEVWAGQIEYCVTYPEDQNDPSSSQSQTVVLALQRRPSDGPQGTIAFGDAPLPPPSDADAPYPGQYDDGTRWGGWFSAPISGFSYTTQRLRQEDGVIRFAIDPLELWKEWCERQVSIALPDGHPSGLSYACRADVEASKHLFVGRAMPEDDPPTGPRPTREDLCVGPQRVCACDEDGCTSRPGTLRAFELLIDKQTMSGVYPLYGKEPPRIRLKRLQ